ncbi:RDD family protein, partial [Acidovorax cavernicola]
MATENFQSLGGLLSRRVLARVVDLVWLAPSAVTVWLVLRTLQADMNWLWRMACAALCLCILHLAVEPLFLSTLGATPGKALLRLRVGDAQRGQLLSYGTAFGRTLKLVVWGGGFWLLPLMFVTLPLSIAVALRGSQVLPWDRSGNGSRISLVSEWRPLRATLLLVGALIPGLCLPVLMAVAIAIALTAGGTDVADDVSRAVTGRWQWMHRLTGTMIPLDTRWRVAHDELSSERKVMHVVFSLGSGDRNQVRLEMDWGPKSFVDACLRQRVLLQAEGFLFLTDPPLHGATCRLAGGKPTPEGGVHAVVEVAQTGGIDYVITSTYEDSQPDKKAAVRALAALLMAEQG